MTLPRFIGPGAVAFVAIWLVLLFAGRSSMLRDPGTFWHTRTGELILKDGFIREDPYTFTFGGSWWVPYQWGGEVVMAFAHRLGGFDAQLLGAVTLLAALFAWLSTRLLRTGLHPILVGAVVALGLAAAGSHFHVRPHVFTLAALAVTAGLLADCDLGRQPLGRLLWLVPLFVVWANVHGGMLGGLATLVIVGGGWVVFQQLGLPSPLHSKRSLCFLGAVVLGCGSSMLANPYGTDLVKTWRIIMDEPLLKQIIIEHRPLDPAQPYAWSIFGLALVYVATLIGVHWRDLHATWLLPAVWFLETIDRCRHASLFVVVTLVALAAMWPSTRWAAWLARHRRDLYEPDAETAARPCWANWLLPAVCVVASLTLIACRIPVPVIGAGWAQHDPKQWPVELLNDIKVNEPKPGEPNKLFTDYLGGGFVIYHAPGYKVFVDDRCEVFGGQWLLEFVRATNQDTAAAMTRWQERYGKFDYALTTRDTGFDDYFHASPDWECIHCTATAAFYKRRG